MISNVFNSDQFRFSDHFRIFGNVDLDQAEVVCVIDAPLAPSIRWSNGDLIGRIWKEHVLLVGFVPKGVVIQSENHEVTSALDQVKEIKGWDLERVLFLKSRFDEEYKLICKIENALKEDVIDIELQILVGKKSALNQLIRRVIPSSKEREKERQELVNLSANDHAATVKKRVQFWIDRAKRNYNRTCADKYAEIFKLRQASLKAAIERELENNQQLKEMKVIVILEAHQVLDSEMREFLLTKKCVAISSKRLPEIFPEDQIERWGKKEIYRSEEIKPNQDPIILSSDSVMQNKLEAVAPLKGLFRTTTSQDLLRLSPEEIELE